VASALFADLSERFRFTLKRADVFDRVRVSESRFFGQSRLYFANGILDRGELVESEFWIQPERLQAADRSIEIAIPRGIYE
jgi:hypothetical protein